MPVRLLENVCRYRKISKLRNNALGRNTWSHDLDPDLLFSYIACGLTFKGLIAHTVLQQLLASLAADLFHRIDRITDLLLDTSGDLVRLSLLKCKAAMNAVKQKPKIAFDSLLLMLY